MIDLVTSIRDIADSLPALSGGVPGTVVQDEPDFAIFAADVESRRLPRTRNSVGSRRMRHSRWMHHPMNAMAFAFNPMMNPMMMPQIGGGRAFPNPYASSSDEEYEIIHRAYHSDDDNDSD